MSTTVDALKGALTELAQLREEMARLNAEKAEATAAFQAQHAPLFEAITACAERQVIADEQARALTLAVHDMTGEKKPVAGASVVLRTRYEYDADEALRWAELALPTAIIRKLDTKAIDKIASTGTLPFATAVQTPTAQIGTDLSAYLIPLESPNV